MIETIEVVINGGTMEIIQVGIAGPQGVQGPTGATGSLGQVTGVEVTVGDIHAALVTLGLITA